jgi:glutathione S-transferase
VSRLTIWSWHDRHSEAEIYTIGSRDLIALSDFLGDQPFFFGAQPTILDAAAYGIVRNLVAFGDRMTAQFYPG